MLIRTTTIDEVRAYTKIWKSEGKTIGLVPTMGFLHKGHGSLIAKAVEENDIVVVSDFVNPIQFGPNEDFDSYPRDFEADCKLCEDTGATMIFHPEPSEMYKDPKTYVDINDMDETLCGAKRAGHFRGVCTVVTKLLNIVQPDRAYFGQKDAQQLAIVRKMVFDLSIPVEIVGLPIVREDDGLAVSSRNTYLSPEERQAALCIHRGLEAGRIAAAQGADAAGVKMAIQTQIISEPLAKIDYIEVVDYMTMKPVEKIDRTVLVAVAVYIGKTRLIDNFVYEV